MKNELKKSMTKKVWIKSQKQKRVLTTMNTGTRDMQTVKHPSRAKRKELVRREVN